MRATALALLAFGVASSSCSGSRAPSPPPASAAPATTAAAATAPPPPPPAPAPAPAATDLLSPAAPAELPAACEGAALDVDRLGFECREPDMHAPRLNADALRAELVPAEPSGKKGEPIAAVIRLTNPTAAPITVHIHVGCNAFEATVDPGAARADDDPACRGYGGMCGSDPLRLTVLPGGTIEKAIEISSWVSRMESTQSLYDSGSRSCKRRDVRPLPRGRYTVSVPVVGRTVSGTITIK